MATKRLRIFAGPNGSGKSTIHKNLLEKGEVNLGIFVNADEIEKALKQSLCLDFTRYSIQIDFIDFCEKYQESPFYALSGGADIIQSLSFENNCLRVEDNSLINSYFAAFITDYIRVHMLDCVDVFTIETVMTHPSKLDFIRLAKSKGYRIYLYYVSTRDTQINIQRVKSRVMKNGHHVPDEKIASRYVKSMENLYEALLDSDRAYLFDNSSEDEPIWYVEYDGEELLIKADEIPSWLDQYLIQKIKFPII